MRKKILTWLLTLALLIGAWALVKVTPSEEAAQAPFPRTAEIGEEVTIRNLSVTVTDVVAARRVSGPGDWSADGTWVVVDLEAAAEGAQKNALLGVAQLVIGERTYAATERALTFTRQRLVTGVPRSGSLAFEVPHDALAGEAVLHLGMSASIGEILLDEMIEVPIDLGALPIEAEATIEKNGWAR